MIAHLIPLIVLVAATAANAQTALAPLPVGLTPAQPAIEELWAETFVRIRRPLGRTNAPWDRPPAVNAVTYNGAIPLSQTRSVGVSALFSNNVGCDMGPNGKNAVQQPVVCPGRIALFEDGAIIAVADIPKVCLASLMTSPGDVYDTVISPMADGKTVKIVGRKNAAPIKGDFSGIKDCTISVTVPR